MSKYYKYSGIFNSGKDLNNAFRNKVGVDGRIIESLETLKKEKQVDPFHKKLLEEINESDEVVVYDFGGAGGVGFFRIIKDIKNKDKLKWIVFEVDTVVDDYNKFFESTGYNIECQNSSSFDEFDKTIKEKKIIFYSIGAIQYVDLPLNFMKELKPFDSVYLKDLNVGKIPNFLTIQKGVDRCWFNNIDEVEQIFKDNNFNYKISQKYNSFHDMSNFPKEYQLNHMCNIIAKKND